PRLVQAGVLVHGGRAAAVEAVDPAGDDARDEPAHDRADVRDVRVALPVAEVDAARLEVVAVVVAAVTAARTARAGQGVAVHVVADVGAAAQPGAAVVALPPAAHVHPGRTAEVRAARQRAAERGVAAAAAAPRGTAGARSPDHLGRAHRPRGERD